MSGGSGSTAPVIIASDIRMPNTVNTNSGVFSVELPLPYSRWLMEILHILPTRAWLAR